MRISYSQLEWFLRCPYLYKYQYIDKNKFPKGKDAIFGSLLHDTLEHVYAQRPVFPTLSETLTFFEKEWERKEAESFFDSPLDAGVHFKEGLRIIKDYYSKNDFEHSNVLALEKLFEVPIEDPRTKEMHLLTGRIDRIDKTAQGIEVIDYKTNKTLKSKKQVAQDLQLALYHLGIASLWPDLVTQYKDNIYVSLYFLRHNEKVSVQKKQEELDDIKDKLLGYIQDITRAIAKDEFPPRPSLLCGREPYSRICPYFKDRYRIEKPKIASKQEVGEVISEYTSLKAQEKEIKRRIGELGELVHGYLDEQNLEGIFDNETGIIRFQLPRYEVEKEQVKAILNPLGRWEEVLEISQTKLKKLKNELPEEYRAKLDEARKLKGVTKSLRVKNG